MPQVNSRTLSTSLAEPRSLADREHIINLTKNRVSEDQLDAVLDMLGVNDPKIYEQPEG